MHHLFICGVKPGSDVPFTSYSSPVSTSCWSGCRDSKLRTRSRPPGKSRQRSKFCRTLPLHISAFSCRSGPLLPCLTTAPHPREPHPQPRMLASSVEVSDPLPVESPRRRLHSRLRHRQPQARSPVPWLPSRPQSHRRFLELLRAPRAQSVSFGTV